MGFFSVWNQTSRSLITDGKLCIKAHISATVDCRTVLAFASVQSSYLTGKMKFNLALLAVIGLVSLVCGQQQTNQECFTRPNQKHPKECCAIPEIMPPREQLRTCMQKFPRPEGPPTPGNPPAGFNCVAQCMFEDLGIMTNGVLSQDAATSKLVAIVGSSSDWQTVATNSVNTCYQQVASMVSTKDSLGCSAAAGPFMECIPSTMFTNCPTSAWTSSEECTQLKAHLAKGCPMNTLMGHPHRHLQNN